MPLVRITLRKDLKQETKQAISDAVHKGLVEEFKIPDSDFWHIIEELEPHNIQFSRSYLGVEHGDNLVYVQIVAGKGRTAQIKKNLFAAIVRHATESQKEVPPNDIVIVLQENNGLEDYSFGNGEVQLPPHLQALADKLAQEQK
ncbi:Tautomerase enzyme family protein [Tritrichomonas foetus]|uniref:Tautomerase enzyme family protein n=1 Tax=Tritrichomonas foetus TaxID=1144522 RepID=A0A1J4K033_9EUKA|nr:Tautomerase enzyme family protein [Tritrichomonas foetus]|eukprot:OHT02869.1 Tautomerase enzyme family protein [Tritrichomonas foetus]